MEGRRGPGVGFPLLVRALLIEPWGEVERLGVDADVIASRVAPAQNDRCLRLAKAHLVQLQSSQAHGLELRLEIAVGAQITAGQREFRDLDRAPGRERRLGRQGGRLAGCLAPAQLRDRYGGGSEIQGDLGGSPGAPLDHGC